MSERSTRALDSARALVGVDPGTDTFYTRSGLSPPAEQRFSRMLDKLPGVPPATRCLSVKDPWIVLIGDERKPFELRKRRTHYRGPVVLCSSASPSRTNDARHARERYARKGTLWVPAPLGFALYVGDLFDCFPAEPGNGTHARGACCKLVQGEWCWAFRDVHALPRPIPIKGQLGLYTTPRAILLALRRAKLLK